jgi:hypothetical protein
MRRVDPRGRTRRPQDGRRLPPPAIRSRTGSPAPEIPGDPAFLPCSARPFGGVKTFAPAVSRAWGRQVRLPARLRQRVGQCVRLQRNWHNWAVGGSEGFSVRSGSFSPGIPWFRRRRRAGKQPLTWRLPCIRSPALRAPGPVRTSPGRHGVRLREAGALGVSARAPGVRACGCRRFDIGYLNRSKTSGPCRQGVRPLSTGRESRRPGT